MVVILTPIVLMVVGIPGLRSFTSLRVGFLLRSETHFFDMLEDMKQIKLCL